jgi:hypothetical protein
MTLTQILTEIRERLLLSGEYGPGWSATADATAIGQAISRIAALESAAREAVALCGTCDGKGGWGFEDEGLPFQPCPKCAPVRAVISTSLETPVGQCTCEWPMAINVNCPHHSTSKTKTESS